jgi:hypothetical protein
VFIRVKAILIVLLVESPPHAVEQDACPGKYLFVRENNESEVTLGGTNGGSRVWRKETEESFFLVPPFLASFDI